MRLSILLAYAPDPDSYREAVPVTTAVVADANVAATIAGIYVSAEGSRAALRQGSQGFLLVNA